MTTAPTTEWLNDWKQFAARRQEAESQRYLGFEIDPTALWPLLLMDNCQRFRVNTSRVFLARCSRDISIKGAATKLKVSQRIYREWESPDVALFLTQEEIAGLTQVFYYPYQMFVTYTSKWIDGDEYLVQCQRIDHRQLTEGWHYEVSK